MFTDIFAFGEEVKKTLAKRLDGCEFMQGEVIKNNGVRLNSLIIRNKNKSHIAPQLYLDDFYTQYQNGRKLENIADEIVDIYRKQESEPIHHLNIRQFMDFESVKDKICMRLVNFEKNEERLKDMPYRRYLNLAVTYMLPVDVKENMNGCISITNQFLEMWKVNEEKLYELAFVNTPLYSKGVVMPLQDMLGLLNNEVETELTYESNLFDITLDEDILQLYICTNQKKIYGAAAILYPGLLKKMSEYMGDFYILPSSVHETLFLKSSGQLQHEELLQMVKEVNNAEVSPQEVLSDSVYFYDKEKQELYLVA